MSTNKVNTEQLDRYAIGLSGICLVHCLLTTFFIPLFPVLASQFFQDEMVHIVLFLLAFPLSGIALYLGQRKHNKFRFLVVGLLGLSLMFAGLFEYSSELIGAACTTLGVVCVALAHFGNFLSHKRQVSLQVSSQVEKSAYPSANAA